MSKGTVKYFNEHKGWGIIGNEDLGQDVYVHYTAIQMDGYRTLKEGQEVLYEVFTTDSGPRAENVTLHP
jgi:CspA family cold shock protein